MIRINEKAWELVERSVREAAELGWKIDHEPGGTWGIDAGVETNAGYQSGVCLAEISTAGLAGVHFRLGELFARPLPNVEVACDRPFTGCFVSQAANWQVDLEDAKGMGSGPACIKALAEKFKPEGLFDPSDCAVLLLETNQFPGEQSRRRLAEICNVRPDRFVLLASRTSSLAGSVQIASRSVETALHKLHHLGFDLKNILSGAGMCPVAPPTGNDLISMGLTNDVMLFGARVWLVVENVREAELESVIQQVPSSTSLAYGKPFLDILKDSGGFYNIDPGLFAPAEITCVHANSGKTFSAGKVDEKRLRTALLGD